MFHPGDSAVNPIAMPRPRNGPYYE